jgi:hypothetical protein
MASFIYFPLFFFSLLKSFFNFFLFFFSSFSYSGWLCRGMLSATSFTLVGVVNKFLTILLNVLVWDKHSTGLGLVAVSICLIAGVFYEQPPRRADGGGNKSSV